MNSIDLNFGNHWVADAWKVLALFLIPIGGGIPSGILLAKNEGMNWLATTVLYFLSDLIQACIFEQMMHFAIRSGKKSPFFANFNAAMKQTAEKMREQYGLSSSPFSLIMLSFGIDPLTGRALGLAAGHGFVLGWTFAIAGDMVFFGIILVSTLCLNNILGDGFWTAVIITVTMVGVPAVFRRLRARFPKKPSQAEGS